MTSNQNTNKPGLAARLKMGLAALALAGVLAGGASAVADVDANPVSSDDTTEIAGRSSETIKFSRGGWAFSRGVSWQ